MTQANSLMALHDYLVSMPAGPIPQGEETQTEELLAAAWHELKDSDAEGMTEWKVLGRTEHLSWEPPNLSFEIEGHGGTVLGSTRADVHRWEIDIETGEASCTPSTYRQESPHAKPVRVEPLVEEVVSSILRQEKHAAVEWLSPTRVRVTPSRMADLGGESQQTIRGRRKRFSTELIGRLTDAGWTRLSIQNRLVFQRLTI